MTVRNQMGLLVGLSLLAVSASAGAARAQGLEEALAQAYATNPTLQTERAALRATDEGVPQALSGWRPTVTVNGSLGEAFISTRRDGVGGSTNTTNTPASVGMRLSQPLYRGGATVAGTQRAENQVLSARANLTDVEQQVLSAASTAYLNVVRDQSVVDLNISNVQVLTRQLEAARDRFEVGEVTRTDVSQAEARVADAEASRVEADGSLQVSRANYQALIGQAPGTLSFPDLAQRVPLPSDLSGVVAQALESNPALARARYAEQAALHDISVAGAELLPEVTLDGELQRAWEPSTFFTRQDSATIETNVTVPLYQSGAEYSRIRQLRQIASQRRTELDQARRTVTESGSQTWENLLAARARIMSFEASVQSNEIALDGVKQEAEVGARTVLDVLDAEQELFNAKVNLVRAQRDAAVATFELARVLGTMTAQALNLPVTLYDPSEHYQEVRDKWIGFGSDYQGRGLFDGASDMFDLFR